MKKILPLLLLFITLSSCNLIKKTSHSSKVTTFSLKDTVYISTFKLLPNTQALLSRFDIASDYYPSIAYNHRIKYIILHYTAADNETSARILTQKDVSSHYLIQSYNDRNIQLLVPESERAWHAGVSYWRGKENLNDTSIGIEIVNPGYSVSGTNKVFYEYDEKQIEKVVLLIADIAARYQIEPYNIIGHSDVAPDRKQDPGPMFPWKKLYKEHNLGAWYDDYDVSYYNSTYPGNEMAQTYGFIFDAQQALKDFGYSIQTTGSWDANNKKVVEAFQYHFRPEICNGIMDQETWAILKSMVKKYPSK